MPSFLDIPTEIRQKILALIILTSIPPPAHPFDSQDRVRLREKCAVWVPAHPAPHPALPLVLTCRALYQDVVGLLHLKGIPYELDVMFVPGSGLWLTWVCCPLPSQLRFETLRVSFRVFRLSSLANRFGGHCDFYMRDENSKFPPGALNFYYLLLSLLTLGPSGVTIPTGHRTGEAPGSLSPCRFTVGKLVLDVTVSEPKTRFRTSWRRRYLTHTDNYSPFAHNETEKWFPGPPRDSPYRWTGFTTSSNPRRGDGADRLGLFLANDFWALVDFGPMSRAYGLVAYEGILDSVEISVDGEVHMLYDMEDILVRMQDAVCEPDDMEDLIRWRTWVEGWRSEAREGHHFTESRPEVPFEALPIGERRGAVSRGRE